MIRESADLIVKSVFYEMFEDGVVMIPPFDSILSRNVIEDAGRIYRVELSWKEEDVDPLAQEFKHFVASLFEIGDWYSNSGKPFGAKPDEDFMAEEQSMDVWDKYISGYEEFYKSPEGYISLNKFDNLKDRMDEILRFMAFRYCYFTSIDAHESVWIDALEVLARVYVMDRFARKVEQIDMLMDEHDTRSYFPLRDHLTLDDFKKMVFYIEGRINIDTRKGKIFYEKTRTDRATEKLYNELINMDI